VADLKRSSGLSAFLGPLAWLVPGLGHFLLGMRARGLVLFLTISAMFWAGVAIGGLPKVIDPVGNRNWFIGELCTGGNALLAVYINYTNGWIGAETGSWGKARDIGIVFAGVAGLLNILAVFDVGVRAVTPTSGGSRGEPDDDPADTEDEPKP
jgi:hypothetical protein